MEKQWIFPAKQIGSDVVRGLLAQRGIVEEAEVSEFLSAKPQKTYDPFLMKDLEAAADRLILAAEKKERICIYGDYDADGVTATSLMLSILSRLTEELTYYIPSRFDEGYGLNLEAMETIAGCGVKLLVTVDCGSVSYEEVERAKELGMEVIVTDHHNTDGRRRADCLLVNPKQEDCEYPCKYLCGCGVAFKLAQALQRKTDRISKAQLNQELDLVAIATVGDIVPLLDENRTLVKHGMGKIDRRQRPGLAELMNQAGLKEGPITSDQIAFVIVPHLNAAGRMLSARAGVELLTAGRLTQLSQITSEGIETLKMPPSEVGRLVYEKAAAMVENNKERKRIQEKTFRHCLEIIEESHQNDLFYVVDAEDAHEGIAGIVAGKIRETCYHPTILVTASGEHGEYLKGTGRSLEGIDLFQLLSKQEDLFLRFGGHAGACGFLMERHQLEPLREGLNRALEEFLKEDPSLFTPKLSISRELSGGELSISLVDEVARLAPFGNQNPKPCFAIRNLTLRSVFYMGTERQHVRLTVAGPQGGEFQCVLFQRAQEFASLLSQRMEDEQTIEAAGSLEINEWKGNRKIQLILEDIH